MRRIKEPLEFNKPIAWVCQTYEVNGRTEVRVIREGMNRADILANFPPHWASNGKVDFGRKDLIKAIIYEAYQEAAAGAIRDRKNIRGFWYERLFHTLIRVMGEPGDAKNIASIESSINEAWGELVEEGYVTYSALSLYSEKENNYRIEIREDSPYPTAIVLVEKASLYDALNDIAQTYEISFTCAGGQNSRAAAMEYADKLERIGIDLSQDFTIFSFCDFDPEGWAIPLGFIDHLRLKVTGNIRLVRLGVLPEHLGESVIRYQAIPYSLEAENESAKKAKQTKYDNFIQETGGLFIPGPNGEQIPARVELNIYTDSQIREKIIEGLSQRLEGFAYQVRKFKESIAEQYQQAWSKLVNDAYDATNEEYEEYFKAIREAKQQLDNESLQRAAEERQEIARLQREIDLLQDTVIAKTSDLTEKKERLRRLESGLEGMAYEAAKGLVEDLQFSDIPSPDDLIERIESNGGWRHWATDLSLTTVDSEALTAAAKQRTVLSIKMPWNDLSAIQDWIISEIKSESDIEMSPDLPDESPEDLIARALGEGAGDD